MQVSKEDSVREAKRIAEIWSKTGHCDASIAYGKQCREWDLLRWQQQAFADEVRNQLKLIEQEKNHGA